MNIALIVALTESGIIGRGGDLPWRLSSDLRRFKQLTMGHAMVMGRKTWESIGRPLPGRESIVLSRRGDLRIDLPHVHVVSNLAAACELAGALPDVSQSQIFVIGGGEIYRAALPHATRLYMTRVLAEVEGDTYFPAVDWPCWQLKSSEPCPATPRDEYTTRFEVWDRIEPPVN